MWTYANLYVRLIPAWNCKNFSSIIFKLLFLSSFLYKVISFVHATEQPTHKFMGKKLPSNFRNHFPHAYAAAMCYAVCEIEKVIAENCVKKSLGFLFILLLIYFSYT
jgi:hypothetical protein